MSELRWHPILGQWVISATHRQNRTYKPPVEHCPLCPTQAGSPPTEIPFSNFDIAVFQNKFPSLRRDAAEADVEGTPLYPVRKAEGICEVVVYTPEHNGNLGTCSEEKVRNLIDVWADRYNELGALEYVDYVFIFENRGEAAGVTLHHPHGQIYAYPFIPPICQREIEQSEAHYVQTGRCLFCDVVKEEQNDGRRIVWQNEHIVAFVPFFARFPFEVHIYPQRHVGCISQLNDQERWALARAMQQVIRRYDRLFGVPMPYMMAMHQQPTDGGNYPFYHYHIEFLPLARAENKLKYLAGSESGAGTFITDMAAEEQAQRLVAHGS